MLCKLSLKNIRLGQLAEIARGGWRTVVPRMEDNPLELGDSYEYARCEAFRECFVLANTQHKKNKA